MWNLLIEYFIVCSCGYTIQWLIKTKENVYFSTFYKLNNIECFVLYIIAHFINMLSVKRFNSVVHHVQENEAFCFSSILNCDWMVPLGVTKKNN